MFIFVSEIFSFEIQKKIFFLVVRPLPPSPSSPLSGPTLLSLLTLKHFEIVFLPKDFLLDSPLPPEAIFIPDVHFPYTGHLVFFNIWIPAPS